MDRRITSPWRWQEPLGFVHAHEVQAAQNTLYCAGQLSTNDEGDPVYVGDIRAQVNQAFDNLERVLQEADYTLADVTRLNYYTTDVDTLLANWDVITSRLAAGGCRCTSTLLGVARLAYPETLIEIEATAAK